MASHWRTSDCKPPRVSRTLLSILVDPNNAVVWIVIACPLIFFQSFGDCTECTDYNWYYRLFHAPLFSSLVRSRYLFLFSFSCKFTLWSAGTTKSTIRQVLSFFFFFFFLLTITRSSRLVKIWWSVIASQNTRKICESYSLGRIHELCIYHLFVWWNFCFLHNSQWILFPIHLCLV